MSGGVLTQASNAIDGFQSPASSSVSANSSVSTTSGNIGLVTDTLTFSGASVTGNWLVGASRVMVNNVPVVNQLSTGLTTLSAGGTSPMTVRTPDSKVKVL